MFPKLRNLVKKLVTINVSITLQKKVFKCRLETMLLKISSTDQAVETEN